jgi:hypothetical protein
MGKGRAPGTVIAVIADTHLPRAKRRLPDSCLDRLGRADLILHAGDISTAGVLDELAALGPSVLAVHGNVDEPALRERLPAELQVELDGVRLAMTHDAGPARLVSRPYDMLSLLKINGGAERTCHNLGKSYARKRIKRHALAQKQKLRRVRAKSRPAPQNIRATT